MFQKLIREAEELVEEAEEVVEETVEEAKEITVRDAEEIIGEADAKGEEVRASKHFRKPDGGDHDAALKSIKRSLTMKEEEEQPQSHCLVDSVWFTASITALTMLNTVQMGLEVDYPDWTTLWLVCENIFTAGFAFEMFAKLCVYKWHYFTDSANWLDGSLSFLGILDCWILTIIFGSGGVDLQSLSVLRILRLLRLARLMKLIRSFKPLVLVIQGIIRAMSTAVYVLALCVLIFYVFAIFLTQRMGHENNELYPGYSTEEDIIDEQEFMQNYNPHICFGNMMSSMLTLFNMAVLAEWTEIVRPISFKQPLYLPVFLFFATCVGFGVMNVLIAVIVDVVTTESRKIEIDFRDQMKKKKIKTLDKIQTLLSEIDKNQDGVLEIDELAEAMQDNDRLRELMSTINLPRGWTPDELTDMLDNDGDGVLQYAEFTTSFFRLLDSDDFQQICIMQSSINQVKHLLRDQKHLIGSTQSAMAKDLAEIKAALGMPRKSSSGNLEHQPSSTTPEGLARDALSKPQEAELLSRRQLKEVLKECIHEELADVKSGLGARPENQGVCSQEYFSLNDTAKRQPPAESWKTLESPAGLKTTVEHTRRPSKSNDPGNATSCSEVPVSVNGVAPFRVSDSEVPVSANCVASLRARYERCEQIVKDHSAAHSNHSQSDFETGGCMDSVLHGEDICEAAQPHSCIHDLIFDELTDRLGFEVQWIQDGLPLVARVVPDGAASVQGLLKGDELAECNGMPTAGKDRQEVLQILGMRPLVLRVFRDVAR